MVKAAVLTFCDSAVYNMDRKQVGAINLNLILNVEME
jgi:hypothetical protein